MYDHTFLKFFVVFYVYTNRPIYTFNLLLTYYWVLVCIKCDVYYLNCLDNGLNQYCQLQKKRKIKYTTN